MTRHHHTPRVKSPREIHAERAASKALERSGYDPAEDNAEYPEIALHIAHMRLAGMLLVQRDDDLPRERAAPITAADLRSRGHERAWRAMADAPRPITTEHDDDIPF